MHGIYELRDKLCGELEKYGSKEMSAGALDVVDKLAHAVKNIDKIIEADEGGYSSDGYVRSNRGSYARRRDSMGRYSGNYSRGGDIVDRLRDLMDDAPNDHARQEIQRLVTKMEQM